MFEAGHMRDQTGQTLFEVFIQKSVHDGIRADRGHGGQMASWEYHQHHFFLLLAAPERLQCVDDNVKDVERGPGEEEDDTDRDEDGVDLLPPHHLSRPSVRGETLGGLTGEAMTNSGEKQTLRFTILQIQLLEIKVIWSKTAELLDKSKLVADWFWLFSSFDLTCQENVFLLTWCRQFPPPLWATGTGRQSRPRCRLSCCVEAPTSAVRVLYYSRQIINVGGFTS